MPVYLNDKGKSYIYDSYCDYGQLLYYSNYEEQRELKNISDTLWIGWKPFAGIALPPEEDFLFDKAYMVIIQKEEENIIGCVIIELIQDDDVYFVYYATVVESVSFPKVDDKYQKIKRSYIDNKLKKIKEPTIKENSSSSI